MCGDPQARARGGLVQQRGVSAETQHDGERHIAGGRLAELLHQSHSLSSQRTAAQHARLLPVQPEAGVQRPGGERAAAGHAGARHAVHSLPRPGAAAFFRLHVQDDAEYRQLFGHLRFPLFIGPVRQGCPQSADFEMGNSK